MLRTILVPLDGSDLAARALPFATRLAAHSGAKLLLLHARPDIRSYFFAHPEAMQIALVRARTDAQVVQSQVEALSEQLHQEGVAAGVAVEAGDPPQLILNAARAQPADLIVMSTHGGGGLGRWLYGSVADAVLRDASIPVLLVSATCEPSWPADRRLRVLVPLDGSAFAEEVLGPASELGQLLDAELNLLRAVEHTDIHGALADAERYLEVIAGQWRATGREVRVRPVAGDPARTIAAVACDERCDLIAMATHGRGGLARAVMGSVATATLRQACVPLLLVRPSAVRQAAPAERAAGRPAAEAEHPTVNVPLTRGELELLQRTLQGIEHTEGSQPLGESIRGLLAKLKAAQEMRDASVNQPDSREGSEKDAGPGASADRGPR